MYVNFTHHAKRQLERMAVRMILQHVVDNGWRIDGVDDGGEEVVPAATVAEAHEAVFAVDEARVYVSKKVPGPTGYPTDNETKRGWMYFTLGNDPEEVLSDYTVNIAELDDYDVEKALVTAIEGLIEKEATDGVSVETE
jgi:hypothetical protein